MQVVIVTSPFWLVGILLTVIGTRCYKREKRKMATCSETIMSFVSAMICDRDSNGHTYYRPVFKYTWDGKDYETPSSIGSGAYRKKFPIGSEWKLNINPKKPEDFYITEIRTHGFWLAILLMGVFFLILPIFMAVFLSLVGALNV